MVEKNPKKTKIQSDYLSDSDSLEDEVSQHLHTSQEERLYSTVKGSVQVTQVALAHTTAQCNPTVERGPPKQPKIKKLSKGQASEKQLRPKRRTSHCDILILFSNILCFLYHNIFVTLFRQMYIQLK